MKLLQQHMGFLQKSSKVDEEMEQELLLEKQAEEHHHDELRESRHNARQWMLGLSIGIAFTLVVFLVTQVPFRSVVYAEKFPRPHIPSTRVTFERDNRYASPSNAESDEPWGSMMPPGDGFVVVDSPSTYSLPPGKDTTKGQAYDISLWHQLHCLRHIRTFLYTLKSSSLDAASSSSAVWELLLQPQEDHPE